MPVATPTASSPFETLYKRLNAAQRMAVDAIEGPVMVIAGPGTGKTSILTLRIANILKRTDTPAHGILAITYTDAGVKAMRAKLHGIIGGRAHDVRIHTFHGFAAAMIAEYPDHFLQLEGMKQMTEIDQESMVRSIISVPVFADLHPAGRPDAYISGILRAIDDSKREALTPAMVREHATKEIERIKNDESSISSRGATKGQLKAEAKEAIEKCERTLLFADVYEKYEDQKRVAQLLDFNDLIIELLVALRNDELLLRLIQERFLYLLVDEHQDTNDAQNFIIAHIAEFFETPNIFIVGDEKQAIYRFQGASVENFLLLQKRWPSMQVISLDTNYRSHQSILDVSYGMIENNYEGDEHKDLRVKLSSGGGMEAQPIDIVTGANTAAIEEYLVKELKLIAQNEPEATVAIITRRNRDLDRVIRLLESRHIPIASERSVDIFNHPVGALFFDLIEYLADPSRLDALSKTIVAGMWNVPIEKAAPLIAALKSGNTGTDGTDVSKELPGLLHIQRRLLNDGPVAFLINAAERSGFARIVASNPSYAHVWRGIVALGESLAREGNIAQPLELMRKMLAYRLSAKERTVKVTVGAPDVPFRAMTAHGSKGLEFDYVFIPYANEESWIGRPRGSSFVLPRKRAVDNDIRDLRRLFYVALTRARQHVSILSAQEESDGSPLSPLRFLAELDGTHAHHTELPRADIQTSERDSDSVRDTSTSPFVDLAKRTLLERGLSVTALNHFISCPSEFIYQSVLRMPQPPSVPAEKGTAMHEAISRVWRSSERAVTGIESILVKTAMEHIDRSLISISEKEALKKELSADLPAVAKALESHFSLKGSVLTESWVESMFEGSFDKKNLRVPIHGKLDAIVDDGHEASVFDYKTKQAMSEAAIKGETKSSDGGYFRQLVFYTLLMQGDPRWRTKKIRQTLVFVSPDSKGRCLQTTLPIAETDIARVKDEIQSLIDSVWSGKIMTDRCSEEDCEWCGLKELNK